MKCPKCNSEISGDERFCPHCGAPVEDKPTYTLSLSGCMDKDSLSFNPGDNFGERYTIIEEIGRGGMGRIFKARDKVLNIDVAIKMIHPELLSKANTVERFKTETLLARQVSHDNIIRIYDFGEEKGIKFISMEYIAGENLAELIRTTGILSNETAIKITKKIAQGLYAAHEKNIIHRDLKPQNIMIDKTGEVYITDFGLAKAIDDHGITHTGTIVGTPQYISPEQAKGEKADKRSDIYALGIIMYEMLTGHELFTSDTALGYLQKHIYEKPIPPSTYNPAIPKYLENIILKCLRKNPADRYQEAQELLNDLENEKFKTGPIFISTTCRQIKKIALVVSSIVVLAVLIFVVIRSLGNKTPGNIPGDTTQTQQLTMKSIAILPFTNLSGDPKLEPWGRVMQSLLTHDLKQSTHIRVLANQVQETGPTGEEKPKEAELIEIATKLKVDYLVIGTYSEHNRMFKAEIQLFDAANEKLFSPVPGAGTREDIFSIIDQWTVGLKKNVLTQKEIQADTDKKIKEITTTSPEAYLYFLEGEDYYWQSEYEKSIEALKKAVQLDPQFALAYISLIVNYLDLEMDEETEVYLIQAYNLKDKIPEKERLLVLGFFFEMIEESPQKAIEMFQELVRNYPNYERGRIYLGVIYRGLEDWQNAEETFRNLLEINKGSWDAVINLVSIDMKTGNYDEALELLLEKKNFFYKDPAYHRYLALIYFYQHKFALAGDEINLYHECSGKKDNTYFDLMAQYYLYQGDFANAEANYRKIIESDNLTESAWYLLDLGNLYLTQGKFSKCIKEYNEWLKLCEDTGKDIQRLNLTLFLAYVNLRLHNSDAAIDLTQHVLEETARHTTPNYLYTKIMALHFKGWGLLQANKINEAKDTAKELGRLAGTTENLRYSRNINHLTGLILTHGKKISPGAVHYFNTAVKNAPHSYNDLEDLAFYIDSLAGENVKGRDLKVAQALYEKIQNLTLGRSRLGDNYTRSFYHLGNLFQEQGQIQDALEQFTKFIAIWKDADPDLPELLDAKKKIQQLQDER